MVQSFNISQKNLNKVISILMDKSKLLKTYIFIKITNPAWPHRQGGFRVCLRLQGGLSAHAAPIYIEHDDLRGYYP